MNLAPLRIASLVAFATLTAGSALADNPGLANSTVLVIRHAEKPAEGTGLTPAGEKRANAYVAYFKSFKVGSKPAHIDTIFATKDSKKSFRERLTVLPLSQALHETLNLQYKDKAFGDMVGAMKQKSFGKTVLICWHHGNIAPMLDAFGADSKKVLGAAKWPDDQFGWVIQLRFDGKGNLTDAKKIVEPF